MTSKCQICGKVGISLNIRWLGEIPDVEYLCRAGLLGGCFYWARQNFDQLHLKAQQIAAKQEPSVGHFSKFKSKAKPFTFPSGSSDETCAEQGMPWYIMGIGGY